MYSRNFLRVDKVIRLIDFMVAFLLLLQWHPLRSIIASISSGVVSIWAQAQIENWSAFAPDFKELDENVEYEERESEFDVEDEDRSPTRNIQDNDDEDEEVDVVGVQPSSHFLSRYVEKIFLLH